jgi:thiamine-monophosphate kinase
MGRGREFDLIRGFVEGGEPLSPEVMLGPGDDAALLAGGWVISTDLSVEDVHFRRAWLSDEEIGYRAAAASLSDLAAMAAEPVALLLSVAAPVAGGVDLAAINAGVRRLAADFGASVIGGDLSRSPGPLLLDVIVLGKATWPVRRDGAGVGDEVWVTGQLGRSAAAVRIWQAGGTPSAVLRGAFVRPEPRVREACCLVEHGVVEALIDVSDGLVGDLGHVAAASGVAITIDTARVPVAPEVVDALGSTEALDVALHGGEDYELCFVAPAGTIDADYFTSRHGISLSRVGITGEGSGVWLRTAAGATVEATAGGFDHWAGTDTPGATP